MADAGAYSVLVSNAAGSVSSNSATLTVNPAIVTETLTQSSSLAIVPQLYRSKAGQNGRTHPPSPSEPSTVPSDPSDTLWVSKAARPQNLPEGE